MFFGSTTPAVIILARIGPRELTLEGDIGGPPRSELHT